jgi:predicted ATPase
VRRKQRLLNRLLAIADIPERLRSVVLEKSGGNPFFIEELVRTLIESGVVVSELRETNGEMLKYWIAARDEADFEIPDNLQSLLSARLDRLEEATRATLQVASVIGRTFYHRVLQVVDLASQELDKHLSTLLRLEMIREASRMPELEYAFRNPLTQEAVYNTILLKNRRSFHKRVGEAIEELYADRLEAFYGLLAHHFSLAGSPEKAIEYTRLAAKQAANLFAYEEAALNLHAALSMAETESWTEGRIILYEDLGDIYHLQQTFSRRSRYITSPLICWK